MLRRVTTESSLSTEPTATPATATVAVHPYRLSQLDDRKDTLPGAGELMLIRFQGGWRGAGSQECSNWLSARDRQLARLQLNAALRKRFVLSRAVLRWVLSLLCSCAPADVAIDEGQDGRLFFDISDNEAMVRRYAIDIDFAGIWGVIAIAQASNAFGLGLHAPPPAAGNDPLACATKARMAARSRSVAHAQGSERVPQHWHVLDLPMPGTLSAALASSRPIVHIDAFGWTKTEITLQWQ